ncbi:MAG TPA: hypothetical protein VOB72_13140 [Candidatus Dormibacteraeota bacterium]|nr:hypothetical protein [Candidatus Dormibacteraeota bacterium]
MAQQTLPRTTGVTFNRPVTVRVPMDVLYDIDKVQRIQKDILGRLGCMACCSGFDIRFVHESEFVVDAKLNVRSSDSLGLSSGG